MSSIETIDSSRRQLPLSLPPLNYRWPSLNREHNARTGRPRACDRRFGPARGRNQCGRATGPFVFLAISPRARSPPPLPLLVLSSPPRYFFFRGLKYEAPLSFSLSLLPVLYNVFLIATEIRKRDTARPAEIYERPRLSPSLFLVFVLLFSRECASSLSFVRSSACSARSPKILARYFLEFLINGKYFSIKPPVRT